MMRRTAFIGSLILAPWMGFSQGGARLPDVSPTVKAALVLPVPLGNPLFNSVTETLGQLDAVFQVPLWKGLGVGVGAKMTWFGVKERALAPLVTRGDIRRTTFTGKVQYEQYTSERTFYELSARAGPSTYDFICPTCSDDSRRTVFHWALNATYFLHASDNLAFSLGLGYETDATRFSATDLGLEGFPGRIETAESGNFRNLLVSMGFSTRLRRSDEGPRGW